MMAEPSNMTSEGHNLHVESGYETILFPIIYTLVFITGSFGNIIAIFLTYTYIQQKNTLGIYLMNLCISDSLYIMTLPLWIIYTANHDSWPWSETTCRLVGFVFYTNNYTTIMFLCCIALDRCLAVAFPLRSRGLRCTCVAIAVCTLVWVLLILSHTPLITHPQLFVDSHNHNVCYEKQEEPWVKRIIYFRVFAGFLVPLCLVVVSYSCIIHIVRRTCVVDKRQKVKIISLVVAILVIFVVSYLPYHVLLLIRSLNDTDKELTHAYRLCFTLTSLSSALNPFLNVFVSENFSNDFGKVVARLTRCLTTPKYCQRRDEGQQQRSSTQLQQEIQLPTQSTSL